MERSHGRVIMGEILIEGIMREDSWERNYGRGIMSHARESWGIHVKLRMSNVWEARGILEKSHGRGIRGEIPIEGIMREDPGRGITGEES